MITYLYMKRHVKNPEKTNVIFIRRRLLVLLILLVPPISFRLLRSNRAVMNFLTDRLTHPVRGFIAAVCSITVWSVAEWLLILAVLSAVAFIVFFTASLIKNSREVFFVIFRYLSSAGITALTIMTLMALMWNANYYADSFSQKSGIVAGETGVEELYETTRLMAALLSGSSGSVARDDNLLFAEDMDMLFNESTTVFRGIEQEYPFLKGRELRCKKVFFSKGLSEIRTTGVAFPLTGEANINIDQPAAFIPSTIAHEIAHQRKVASEQEANFVAVLACEMSDSAAFRYSGYLFAYDYLAGALAREDYGRFREINDSLDDGVKADLRFSYEYWRQYEGKISEVSDSIYDDYLKTQGQEMGTKSYGAVVDLLIEYYYSRNEFN